MNFKNLVALVVIVGLIGAGISFYLKEDTCATGITYKIESVDERFELSKGTLESILFDAETVWENAYGGDIFTYDEKNGKLKIRLTYDERQERTDREINARVELEEQKADVDVEVARLESLKKTIEREESVYQGYVSQYDRALAQLNRRKESGATSKELQGMEVTVNLLVNQINSSQTRLNSAIEEFNTLLNKTELTADQYNSIVDDYNKQFTGEYEFDQGEHVSNQITIYEFESLEALRLVLVHEMGHALGIGHIEDPKGIMYYLLNDQDIYNIQLSEEDIKALQTVCALGN